MNGQPRSKRTGSRASRRQNSKTAKALREAREYYRECLERRKDKSRGA